MERKLIVRVRNLAAGYAGDIILQNVSFDVYEGEIFVVLGGSGCGKSTLLKHLIGLFRPIEGQVFIEDHDISECDDKTLHAVLRKIGVLYQSGALFGSMTVAENIALPIEEYTDLPEESVETLVKLKLALVRLEGFEGSLPSELSGGMKKRAALARAMALNPRILFFDEPSAGLDPVTSAGLDELIIRFNRILGVTIVLVTHDLPSIFRVAHRVIMLDKRARGIIAEGDPRYLREHSRDPFVRRFFNREPEE